MSVHADSTVTLLLADYIGVDAGGKINVIGGGFSISGIQPTGFTAPQYLAVIIDMPRRYVGEEFTFSVALRNSETNALVQAPGPSGQSEALRVQQLMKSGHPMIGADPLPDVVPARVQTVIAFPNGVPVPLGHLYKWQVEIDDQTKAGWSTYFYVPGPTPSPVFGGPAGPSSIPGVS